MTTETIPETIPTSIAFKALLCHIIENGYGDLQRMADGYEDVYDTHDDWAFDLSEAIETAACNLCLPTDAESCGTYFDWAEEVGYYYTGPDGGEG